jgi:hypothetical protein
MNANGSIFVKGPSDREDGEIAMIIIIGLA